MTTTSLPRELEQLAEFCGVQCAYEDATKRRREASVESILAALQALETGVESLDDVPTVLAAQQDSRFERGIEPVVVAWEGRPLEFDLMLSASSRAGHFDVQIESEDARVSQAEQIDLSDFAPVASPCGRFATRRVRLRQQVPIGYHCITLRESARTSQTTGRKELTSQLISAPVRAYEDKAASGAEWGCFVPLYALRSERNWGAGDFTDLGNLATWADELGARVIGTLPLLAAFLDEPCEPSPYAPASRLAWNEFYVDPTHIPELSQCPAAAALLKSTDLLDEARKLRNTEYVDYRSTMALKRRVLEAVADDFFSRTPQPRLAQFEQFLNQHPHVQDYAAFRATYERRREPWHQWPQTLRDGHLNDGDVDLCAKRYHMVVQWIATEQLESLADAMGGGFYLDLPLGVRPDGYDVWRWREAYACGASAGSPPDPMWTEGQDWCFPPLHPERIRLPGYRHVRDYLSHHLRLARMLRIDHVMQLHRLYWIPQGMNAKQGVYVRYRPDEFYAILNLESHRHRTTLIGENLGTVPREVDQAMDRHGMKRMYVVQYEIAGASDANLDETTGPDRSRKKNTEPTHRSARLSPVPVGALASLNTHDMPMFAAWWRKEDIPFRQRLGLLTEAQARREMDAFDKIKTELVAWLDAEKWFDGSGRDDLAVLHAILKYLAVSDAAVVLVNLEDLWLETRPQNVPGTGPELPNWRRKAAKTISEITQSAEVRSILELVARWRQQSRLASGPLGPASPAH